MFTTVYKLNRYKQRHKSERKGVTGGSHRALPSCNHCVYSDTATADHRQGRTRRLTAGHRGTTNLTIYRYHVTSPTPRPTNTNSIDFISCVVYRNDCTWNSSWPRRQESPFLGKLWRIYNKTAIQFGFKSISKVVQVGGIVQIFSTRFICEVQISGFIAYKFDTV